MLKSTVFLIILIYSKFITSKNYSNNSELSFQDKINVIKDIFWSGAVQRKVDLFVLSGRKDNRRAQSNSKYILKPNFGAMDRKMLHKKRFKVVTDVPLENVQPTRRIVGGREASILDFPFMVSIMLKGKLWCGGTILAERWILTAAHCMKLIYIDGPEQSENFYIRAGSRFHDSGGQVVKVDSAYFHDFYDHRIPDFDVSLVRLKEAIHLGIGAVLDLAGPGFPIYVGDIITVAGWGSTDIKGRGKPSKQLKFVLIPLISRVECQRGYNVTIITSRHLCATNKDGGKDACNHDSGSPATVQGVLVGVVAFGGSECGTPRWPGVYTSVAPLTSWITRTIDDNEVKTDPLTVATSHFRPKNFKLSP